MEQITKDLVVLLKGFIHSHMMLQKQNELLKKKIAELKPDPEAWREM